MPSVSRYEQIRHSDHACLRSVRIPLGIGVEKTRNSQTSTNKNGKLADNLLVSVVWAVAKLSEPFPLWPANPQSRPPGRQRLAIVLVMAVNKRADINSMDLVSVWPC